MDRVAIPLVTAVWYHESFVPSPAYDVKDDGTHVTNFPDSLALWAGVDDADRKACDVETQQCVSPEATNAFQRYKDGIQKAIRKAEGDVPSAEEIKAEGPPYDCKSRTRFGVGPETARINRAFSVEEIKDAMKTLGYSPDFVAGHLVPLDEATS